MIENSIINWWKSFYEPKKEFVDYKKKNEKQRKHIEKQIKENEKYKNSWASELWKMLAWEKTPFKNDYIDYNKHNDDYYEGLEKIKNDDNEDLPPFLN